VSSYIKDLVANIQKSFAQGKHDIQFNFDLIKKDIQMALAVPLGLIVNELITNAYKYAFINEDDNETKTIKIDFESINNSSKYQLYVADNGKGDKGTAFTIVLEEPKET